MQNQSLVRHFLLRESHAGKDSKLKDDLRTAFQRSAKSMLPQEHGAPVTLDQGNFIATQWGWRCHVRGLGFFNSISFWENRRGRELDVAASTALADKILSLPGKMKQALIANLSDPAPE